MTEHRRHLRVLLVDDSTEFLDAAERFLKAEEGITVIGRALSGEESLGMVAALAPDLVLMDLVMPGIGGLKATRHIKAVKPAPRVVILTLHDHSDARQRARRVGDGFLSKARFVDDLGKVLDQLFPKEHGHA
jgi:NarL family two-component system response regulator LiaR